MKNILYVSRAGLPIDATGVRITAIGKLLNRIGYRVHYICERRIDSQIKNSGFQIIDQREVKKHFAVYLRKSEYHYEVDGNIYSYLPEHSGRKSDAMRDMMDLYTARESFKRIVHLCEKESPEILILYNDIYGITKKMIPYCRKKGIVLLADVTEWYEKRKYGTLAERMVVFLTDKRIRLLDKKLDGVIAISPFFYDYYQKMGVKAILIPPLMEIDSLNVQTVTVTQEKDSTDTIRFVYAGSPGSKDIIIPFIHSIVAANHEKVKFRLDLVGIDYAYLEMHGCAEANEQVGIFAFGRLPRQDTVDVVRKADFGILFRHNQRYAKAGFSTKFVECMSLGVAMICNRIGGTDQFITDGIDGFVLDTANEKAIGEFLTYISQKDRTYIEMMKKNALEKAKHIFDLKNYEAGFHCFLKEVQKSEY